MKNFSDQQNNSAYPVTPVKPITAGEAQLWFTWAALATGAILLLFAGPISFESVRERHAANSYQWNTSRAHDMAFNLRIIGAALFFAGYMERLILKISAMKS